MHKEARLNTNEMLTKTMQTGHPKAQGQGRNPCSDRNYTSRGSALRSMGYGGGC
ncbi:hypothetical protein BDV12DRAFT_181814 [Aspergillus spectabilis]